LLLEGRLIKNCNKREEEKCWTFFCTCIFKIVNRKPVHPMTPWKQQLTDYSFPPKTYQLFSPPKLTIPFSRQNNWYNFPADMNTTIFPPKHCKILFVCSWLLDWLVINWIWSAGLLSSLQSKETLSHIHTHPSRWYRLVYTYTHTLAHLYFILGKVQVGLINQSINKHIVGKGKKNFLKLCV